MPVQFEGGMYGGMLPPLRPMGSNCSTPYSNNMSSYANNTNPYYGASPPQGQYNTQNNLNAYSNNPSQYQPYYSQPKNPY